MRIVCLLFVAGVLLASAADFVFEKHATSLEEALGGVSPQESFKSWSAKHNKRYANAKEYAHRYGVWLANAQKVVDRNQEPGRKLKLGLNGLADMSSEEFRTKMLSPRTLNSPDTAHNAVAEVGKIDKPHYFNWRYERIKPRPKVDWRTANIMGPIRSQHANNWSCGGCWAFATVGIAEASSALTTGVTIPGSEQQLIDCDDKHDHGCDGGEFHNALDYIIYNKGLTTEDNYPYAGQTNPCDYRKEKDHQVKIDDWESVPPYNETALMQAISMRPVISAICCGNNIDDWHHYDGGVFDVPCCHDKLELDHAIVLAGYDVTPEGEPYYILKNSWSEDWGEKGYMRIKRFVGPKPFVSQCGLASMPTMVFRGPKPPSPKQEEEEEDDHGAVGRGEETHEAAVGRTDAAAREVQVGAQSVFDMMKAALGKGGGVLHFLGRKARVQRDA